jgi:hypothetical protein
VGYSFEMASAPYRDPACARAAMVRCSGCGEDEGLVPDATKCVTCLRVAARDRELLELFLAVGGVGAVLLAPLVIVGSLFVLVLQAYLFTH